VGGRRLAISLMVTSSLSFALMGAFVKATPEVPVALKVVCRNLVTLAVAGVLVARSGVPFLGRPGNRPLLLARSVLGIIGVTAYFWTIDNLMLADAAMLNKLSPFFVTIFAAAFLAEPIRRPVAMALVLAFLGALLIIKPRFDLSVLPAMVGLLSAAGAGGAYVVVRALRSREQPQTIIFVFSLVTVVGLLPAALAVSHRPSPTELAMMIAIGLFAAGGQFGLTAAFRYAPASEVALYSYSTVVFSALIGLVVWNELPDLWSVTGGCAIVAAGALPIFLRRAAEPASQRSPGGRG
jgi:drug/metabolite transporter (DMT)-like permease